MCCDLQLYLAKCKAHWPEWRRLSLQTPSCWPLCYLQLANISACVSSIRAVVRIANDNDNISCKRNEDAAMLIMDTSLALWRPIKHQQTARSPLTSQERENQTLTVAWLMRRPKHRLRAPWTIQKGCYLLLLSQDHFSTVSRCYKRKYSRKIPYHPANLVSLSLFGCKLSWYFGKYPHY